MTSTEVPRHPRAAGLLLGGILTGLLLASGSLGLWVLVATPGPVRTDATQQVYREPVSDIDLKLDSGTVTLVGGQPGAVTVQRQLSWARAKPVVAERIVGRTLQIRIECPRSFLGRPDRCRVDVGLEVPPGVAVRASTQWGGIHAEQLTGALQLTTGSGDITATGTKGALWARTDMGDVVGTDLAGLEASVKSHSATVDLRFAVVPDHVEAETDHGDVTVAVPAAGSGAEGYQVRAGTTVGRRDIDIAENAGGRHTITAFTDRGNVTVRQISVRR